MAVPVGMGTVLSVSTSTGTLGVANIRDIGGPESDSAAIDVTAMDSTGNFREFLGGGPIDPGEVPLELLFDTTSLGMVRLVAAHYAGATKTFTITYNTTGTDTNPFSGIVTRIGQSIPYEDAVMRPITLKVTKTPGFSTTAPA